MKGAYRVLSAAFLLPCMHFAVSPVILLQGRSRAMRKQKSQLGKLGEELAVEYLLRQGYQIRRRNYRYGKAEVDIIASLGSLLVVIEVRSRRSERLERIAETVTRKKIMRIVEATDRYMQVRELKEEVRFDIITVLFTAEVPKIEHLEDAFYHF